jgi:transposase
MNSCKYVALDVDSANIVAGVFDSKGKSMMECFVKTNSTAVRQFFKLLDGTVHVALEEGTQAGWLYDLIRPLVAEVIVCNPRRNKLLQSGNKGDRIDVKKLAKLLRLGELHSVYHGEQAIEGLKQLVHGYQTLVEDSTRAMNRLRAVFRSRGIKCNSTIYSPDKRQQWIEKLDLKAAQMRVGYLYKELDCLMKLRHEAETAMCRQARTHSAYKLIVSVPGLGPVRTAQIIAVVGSPHRFRTKRQLWPYCGLAVVTRSSADYEWVGDRARRRNKPTQTRGLNHNFNRTLKAVFTGAALTAIGSNKEFKQYYQRLTAKGIRPEMARLTVARKLVAVTLTLWKKGEKYDPERLNQAAGTGDQ